MKIMSGKFLRCLMAGVLAAVASLHGADARAAGELGATPQMGFNNWNSTHCRAEFNETMIRGIADKFIELGLKDAGYTYVNIDDCWAESERDAHGNLVVNRQRFSHGLKALADYIHAKGLKFGLYTSAGTHTCADTEHGGFPGGLHHEKQDAALFASFGVDYLKYDNCNNQNIDARIRYQAMGDALRATGRPIFYSLCEWGENKPWLWGGEPVGAQSWRTTGDINDSYKSMLENYEQNVVLDANGGHGRWNDPDMLEVGNGGMSEAEYRSHFSLWAIMASPLLIGTDLRSVSPAALNILLNKEVIAVDQDALGEQGWRMRHDKDSGVDVIIKPLKDGSQAVVVFNSGDSEQAVSVSAKDLRLKDGAHVVRDLWQHSDSQGDGAIAVKLAPHASAMYRISAG